MYKNRQTELPARIRSLVSVRNAFAAVACLAVFLGLLASFDAIAERFFAPDAVTSVLPAKTFPLSGSLPLHTKVASPSLLASLEPDTALILVERFEVRESFFGSAPQWHAILQILPPASPGVYQLSLTLADSGWALPLGQTRIDVFASQEALEENSRSLLLKFLSIAPIDASLALLAVALLFGAAYFVVKRLLAAALADRGYLRVYHTKDAGDDTLLYCADPKKCLTQNARILFCPPQVSFLARPMSLRQADATACFAYMPLALALAASYLSASRPKAQTDALTKRDFKPPASRGGTRRRPFRAIRSPSKQA